MKYSSGLCFILKFRLDRIYSFGDSKVFIFWHFGLETASFTGFGSIFPPNDVVYRSNPKRHLLVRKHVVWAIKRENRPNSSTWARAREKLRTRQDRTVKKSQRRYISPTWGEAPTEPICTKICTVIAVPDVIMCANIWSKIVSGHYFTEGRISDFLIDSCMCLTTVRR